ncbi:MAG: hypothetical protein ACOC56_00580 [Atribacterota bacterium]
MAKKQKEDAVIKNLKGFVRLGAETRSPGNISTGHFDLDFAIHHGCLPGGSDLSEIKNYNSKKVYGMPRGKIVEIFGEEGGGKSSLAYRVCGFAQKMGYSCAWIDTEHSFSDDLARINGMNQSEVYYSDMSNKDDEDVVFHAEDVFDAIIALCKSDVKVIVLDSVANLVPKARMEKEAGKQTVGIVARLMSENLGKIANYASKYGVLIIFINQLREKIGIMFGSPETTPGGRSLKHNSSLRIQISKKGGKDADIYAEDENGQKRLIGRTARCNIRKNRFAKPFFEGIEIPIYYEPYFPDIEDIMFASGRQLQVIKVRKGEFSWGDLSKIEGKRNFINVIKEKSLQSELYGDILEAAQENGVFLPPELSQWAEDNYEEPKIVGDNREADNASEANEKRSTRGRKKKDSTSSSSDD